MVARPFQKSGRIRKAIRVGSNQIQTLCQIFY
jgi:hypothetical protein